MAQHFEFRSLAHDSAPRRRRSSSSSSALARVSGVVYREPVLAAAVLVVLGAGLWSLLHARSAQAASSPR